MQKAVRNLNPLVCGETPALSLLDYEKRWDSSENAWNARKLHPKYGTAGGQQQAIRHKNNSQ